MWRCVGAACVLALAAVQTLAAGALGRVTCDTTNTTVTVKWDLDPSADGGTARIVVRLQETGNKRILRPKEVDASRATSTTFHYLLPFAYYHAKISKRLEKQPSEAWIGEVTCQTKEGIPRKVVDLGVYSAGSSSISLRWYPPARINGRLRRYEVSFRKASELHFKTDNVTDMRIHRLSGLRESTEYHVRVAAVTGAGRGAAVQITARTTTACPEEALSEPPNQGGCTSAAFMALRAKQQAAVDAESTVVLVSELQALTSGDKDVLTGDLQAAVEILSAIGQEGRLESFNETTSALAEKISGTVVHIANNLLSNSTRRTWKRMAKDSRIQGVTDLIHSVENISLATAAWRNSTLPFEANTSSVVLVARTVNSTDDMNQTDILAPRGTKVISFPLGEIAEQGEPTQVVFHYFHHIGELLGSEYERSQSQLESTHLVQEVGRETSTGVVSPWVISVSTSERSATNFKRPIKILVENPQGKHLDNTSCVFWKITRDAGLWSSEGCEVSSSNASGTICHCYHLTSFAVLMQYMPATKELPPDHERLLSLITYVGLGISLTALVLALITFCSLSFLWSSRNFIHVNLVIAMILAELLFVVGINRNENQLACTIIAAFLHYLFLAVFCWMATEGVLLYILLVKVLPSGDSGPRKRIMFGCSWGLPTIPVAITLAFYRQGYGSENHCWLSVDDGFIWFFVGPVLCICLVNTIFLVLVFKSMADRKRMCLNNAQNRPRGIRYWAKACAVLMCLLGTTWLLGLFFVDLQSIAMAYLFNIFNSLQGLFIFVFHCLTDERIRREYRRILCCGGTSRVQMRAIGKEQSRDTAYTRADRKIVTSKVSSLGKLCTRDSMGGVCAERIPIQVSPGPGSPAFPEKSDRGATEPIYEIKLPRSLGELADRLMSHDDEEESQVEQYSEDLSGSLFGRSPDLHSPPPYFTFDRGPPQPGLTRNRTRSRTHSFKLELRKNEEVNCQTDHKGGEEKVDEQAKDGSAKEVYLVGIEPEAPLKKDCAISVKTSERSLTDGTLHPVGERTLPLDEAEGRVEEGSLDNSNCDRDAAPAATDARAPRINAAQAAPTAQSRDTTEGAHWRDTDRSQDQDETNSSGQQKQRGHGPLRCLWRMPSPMCFPKREEIRPSVRYVAEYSEQPQCTRAEATKSSAGSTVEVCSSYKMRFPRAKEMLLQETPRSSLEGGSAIASSESCSDLESSDEDPGSAEARVKEEKSDVRSLVQRFETKGLLRNKRS